MEIEILGDIENYKVNILILEVVQFVFIFFKLLFLFRVFYLETVLNKKSLFFNKVFSHLFWIRLNGKVQIAKFKLMAQITS